MCALDSRALRYVLAVCVLLAGLGLSGEAQGYGTHRILVLHSYHSGMSWVDNLERGIRDELLLPPYEDAIVHTEYMDTKRNQGREYYDRLIHIYKEKYRDVNLDLILATDNNAFDFLLEYRDELFHGAPVVFGGVNNFSDSSLAGVKDFTGAAENVSFGETVEAILDQFPKTKEIFVVNDYLKTGRAWHADILNKQRPYEHRVRFTHNENLTSMEMREKIQSMKPGTVVLLGVYFADRDGMYLTYEKLGSLMTKDSPVPAYCLVRFNLRDNVIGGKVLSGYHHGRLMSEIGRRVLNGEKAGDIPVIKAGTNFYIFNWPGMHKFGVTHEMLPPDSAVINEPYSFYQEYFVLVWSGAGAIFVLFVLVCFLSITVVKLRRARQKLSYSERKYRAIFDNAMAGVFQTTVEGRLLSANAALANMFGYDSPEQLVEQVTNFENDMYACATEREELMALIRREGRAVNRHVRMLNKQGEQVWTSINVSKAQTQDGTAIYEGSFVDITERKLAEQELDRMRKYMANIIDSMPSLLVGVDHDGRITLLNRTALESTALKNAGLTADQVHGKHIAEVFPWLEPYTGEIRESIARHTSWNAAKVLRYEEGETRYEDITIYPLSLEGAQEAVVRIDNVSRSVEMERMMVQSEKMMSIGGLAAGMAHEVNNPLTAVIGYAHNIQKRISDDVGRNVKAAEECGVSLEDVNAYLEKRDIPEMLDGIYQSGKRAAKIVSDMLDFSRKSESSGTARHCVAELLDQAVDLAVNFYDMQREFDFRSVVVTREYESGLPEVACDGNEIQQVFLNLLKNGAEAMAEKKYGGLPPEFKLRAYREGEMAMVEIEDNGPGMPEHVRRRILEPFFTTKPVGKGTGLGLSVSNFIVTDLHKGSMEVRSEEGAWTRFTIGLPIVRD